MEANNMLLTNLKVDDLKKLIKKISLFVDNSSLYEGDIHTFGFGDYYYVDLEFTDGVVDIQVGIDELLKMREEDRELSKEDNN